MNCAKVMETLD